MDIMLWKLIGLFLGIKNTQNGPNKENYKMSNLLFNGEKKTSFSSNE